VLEKFATVQMLDMHLPTTDARKVSLSRYTHPEARLPDAVSRAFQSPR
jgi:hypothetical protein